MKQFVHQYLRNVDGQSFYKPEFDIRNHCQFEWLFRTKWKKL